MIVLVAGKSLLLCRWRGGTVLVDRDRRTWGQTPIPFGATYTALVSWLSVGVFAPRVLRPLRIARVEANYRHRGTDPEELFRRMYVPEPPRQDPLPRRAIVAVPKKHGMSNAFGSFPQWSWREQ